MAVSIAENFPKKAMSACPLMAFSYRLFLFRFRLQIAQMKVNRILG